MNNSMITVVIVDDHKGIRDLTEELVLEEPGFDCIGSYGDSEVALEKIPALSPDIVLMDINMPKHNGIECVQILKPQMPNTAFVMLTVYDEPEYIFKALAAGAVGYLLKRTVDTHLIDALREVLRGGSPMNSQIARLVVQSFQLAEENPDDGLETIVLSEREREVLRLLSQGKVAKEIAKKLDLSIFTVYTYTRRAYEKLHVNTRVEAVAKFIQMDSGK
jgi:DNA-binding NarL/FixJ family response regulator